MKSLFVLVLMFLIGCQGFVHEETIVAEYKLVAADTEEGMVVCYQHKEGFMPTIIGRTVFAVGHNRDFIIVKQHPAQNFQRADRTITNYYIITIKPVHGYEAEKNVIGPLDEGGFLRKRQELGLPEQLVFTRVFKSLE